MGKFSSGFYWNDRQDLLYYQYVDYIVRVIGVNAISLIDVGSANCPYIEWFDWIPNKTAVDLADPYSSRNVIGVKGNVLTLEFAEKFDIVTCLQVLEHIPDPKPFAQRLLELGNRLVVSVPYNWKAGKDKDHIHDPVDLQKMEKWFCRSPNYSIVVKEPFLWASHERLICIYDRDPLCKFGMDDRAKRIRR